MIDNDIRTDDDHRPEGSGWRRTLVGVGAGVVGAAAVGGLLTDPDGAWYRSLRKPSWNPPNTVFPVVWTSLYALITASSAATIHDLQASGRREEARSFQRALAVNLVLNAGWSGLFFRARRPWLGAVGAGVLAASSIDLARRAARTGWTRGAALGSYAAWTSFATALSTEITRLNR